MNTKWIAPILLFVLCLSLPGCASAPQTLTVSEVIEQAESLNGETIRVRGVAYIWTDPSSSEMWNYGGCIPDSAGPPKWDVVIGWLTLYEAIDRNNLNTNGTPREMKGIRIADSSFHCDGGVCGLTCQPFTVSSHQTYEFTGTLHVDETGGPTLEEIDLEQSAWLVDGELQPIPAENFPVVFP
ncbi:MAG: hypothetical protein L6461_01585 [Anaerolineae bacterium]|nr:hypothetical protein [Anaerolineae bacterium]